MKLFRTLSDCAIVKAELIHGHVLGGRRSSNAGLLLSAFAIQISLPFDDACSQAYAELRFKLERVGKRIGYVDMLIAATAIANDMTLVTHNTREFSRIAGLRIEAWQTDIPAAPQGPSFT